MNFTSIHPVHYIWPLASTVFQFWQWLPAGPFAPLVFMGFVATMSQSDSWYVICSPPLIQKFMVAYLIMNISGLPGMRIVHCAFATLSALDGTWTSVAYRLYIAACYDWKHIGFRYLSHMRLNHFTLSHCGSRTSLYMLKPHLTTLAPTLSTGCLSIFIRSGVPPDYIIRIEPAHSCLYYTLNPLDLQGHNI